MNAINHKQSLELLVTELAQLRLTKERADAIFLLRLREVESDHMDLLQANGLESFERFLKSYKLCDAARYRDFVSGLSKIGKDSALAIGADATVEASRLTNGHVTAEKYVHAIGAWRDEHRGVAPTRETSAKILRQVDPRVEEPQAVRDVRQRDELRTKCAKLESEVAQLRHELKKITKERDELKRKLEK